MEMERLLILVYKINHKIIGAVYKNGLFFVSFGLSVDHSTNQAEKYLTQF